MAEIKTIYKGESISLLFTFPAAYDMARLTSQKVFVGETEFAGVVDGQTVKLQLKSSDTDRMIGNHKIVLWMDDTTLGLRKPYCGDLVVAKTQASGNTVSVSDISDIIIPIAISETAVTVVDIMYNYVKGDKGDPFLYSDFTPAQIAELQQPATDAIASIVAVELAVEQAEVLRMQAEIYRETNTGTAIQNAETATQNASDAALLANTKAGLADTAANNANAKATLANNAAILANEKAGLANTAATNADNARLAIAGDLALKEASTNKQNSLTPDGTGTKFPTVDAVNAGLALKANKTQEARITPTLLNGWENYLNERYPVSFMKDELGFVHIVGSITRGTTGTKILVLPVGYRPLYTIDFSAKSNLGTNGMQVRSNGDIYIFGTIGTYTDLSTITFMAEQ